MSCSICETVHKFEAISENMVYWLYQTLAPGCINLLHTLVLGWFLILAISVLMGKKLAWLKTAKRVLAIMVVMLLLKTSNLFFGWVYTPLKGIVVNISTHILNFPQGVSQGGTQELLTVVNETVAKIDNLQNFFNWSVFSGFTGVWIFIQGMVLVSIYHLLLYLYAIYLLEFMFKSLAISALAPFFLLISVFDGTRNYAQGAFNIVLQGALVLIISSIFMSISMVVAEHYFQTTEIFQSKDVVLKGHAWISQEGFWTCLAIPILSIFALRKSHTIASSIINI